MDQGTKSADFRKYYYTALEASVKDIETTAETLHGDRLRTKQSKRLKMMQTCMEQNPAGLESINEACLEKYRERDLGAIRECLQTEKDRAFSCSSAAFNSYLTKEGQSLAVAKSEVDQCLAQFKESVFKVCFAKLN